MKRDRADYTFKFSTELIVLVLSFIIVGVNAAGSAKLEKINSSNLFSKELSYRPNSNKLLYTKTTAVTTVVAADSGIIPAASAQVVLAADQAIINPQNNDNEQDSIISNNAIINPNSDNVRGIIVQQIQNYTVKSGDTIAGIASQFHLQQNTIIWANNLQNQTLKPGMVLQILPIDGVIYTVSRNDTLPDIAKKFKADINQIISYNNLADDSDINAGDVLIIPNGVIPETAKPIPQVKHELRGHVVYGPAPDAIQLSPGDSHIFPWGECTYYVAARRSALGAPVTWGGNAKDWWYNAAAAGRKEGSTPIPGAIIVTKENRRFGHVALVEEISDGKILVSEMNYKGRGIQDERWIDIGSGFIKGYIY